MLEPQVIIDGKPLELRCALTGHPPPEISWYRNNRPFPRRYLMIRGTGVERQPLDYPRPQLTMMGYTLVKQLILMDKILQVEESLWKVGYKRREEGYFFFLIISGGGKKSIRRPGYFKAPVIAPEDKPSVKKPTEDEDELVVPQEVDIQKSAPPNFPPPQYLSDDEGDMSDKSDKRDETGAGSSDEAEDETSMNILPQPNDEKDSERFPETDDDDEGDMSDKSDKRDETGAGSSDEAEDETSVNILPQPNDEKDSERFPETDDQVDYPFNQRRRSLDEDADEGEQKGDSSRESEDEESQEDEESREDEETREDEEKEEEPEPAFKSSFSITVHTSKPDDRDGEDDDDANDSDDSTGSHSTVKSGSTVRSKPSSQVISGEDDSEVDEEEVSKDDPGREPQPSYKTSFAIAIRPSEPKEEDDSYREDSQSEEGSDATPHSPGHSEGYPSYEVLLEDSSLPRLPEDFDDPRDRGKVEVTIETTKVTHISLASIMILDDADVDRDEGGAHSEPPNKEELLLALALDPVFLDPYTQPSTPSETSDDPDWPVIEEDEVVPDKVTTVHAAPNLLRALDPDADWSDDEDGKEKSKIPKRGKKRLEWRVAAIIASFEKVGRPELIITVIDIILMFIVFS
ncbi:hypothetical protein BSL78_02109 [Apostichopus japonicus]|uniref:Ig-like domain-containing protein n=1 Tax=Stichopus japonicus TaxID=307972 RepID=A0A2G8LL03_STIJA|nr:hypothetical protein BSL78_02109 [Apostichopus japonicus]